MRILVVIFMVALAWTNEAHGWSSDTHVAICTAGGYESPERCVDLDRVRTIVKMDQGKSYPPEYAVSTLLEASIRSVPYYGKTYAWHWMNVPLEDGSFKTFVSDIFQKYEDPREGFEVTGGSLVAIKWLLANLQNLEEQETHFLFHLLGDVTQPMHNHVYDAYNRKYHRASDNVDVGDLTQCEIEEVADVFSFAEESARLGWQFVRKNEIEDFTSPEVEAFFHGQACRAVSLVKTTVAP